MSKSYSCIPGPSIFQTLGADGLIEMILFMVALIIGFVYILKEGSAKMGVTIQPPPPSKTYHGRKQMALKVPAFATSLDKVVGQEEQHLAAAIRCRHAVALSLWLPWGPAHDLACFGSERLPFTPTSRPVDGHGHHCQENGTCTKVYEQILSPAGYSPWERVLPAVGFWIPTASFRVSIGLSRWMSMCRCPPRPEQIIDGGDEDSTLVETGIPSPSRFS